MGKMKEIFGISTNINYKYNLEPDNIIEETIVYFFF